MPILIIHFFIRNNMLEIFKICGCWRSKPRYKVFVRSVATARNCSDKTEQMSQSAHIHLTPDKKSTVTLTKKKPSAHKQRVYKSI
ncbi:hypothetical protein ACZ11_18555 [Lysinibacillus xylanilyticus]|uniref:Uncharacterized protein n=1 Tax=Lysinibacillus xylanilyticus TaxID=582475 RepID=A0A0K9F4S4_9BACI|nr:hypothetical protein ACZ11_18555 [Lysinibacillus xylanilyticus]